MYKTFTGLCLIALLTLSGCATDGSSPTFMPPAGSTVEVTQELAARNGARVFIQEGKVMPRSDIGVMRPYCQFFLFRSRDEMRQPIVIRPEVFTVTRTYRQRDFAGAVGLHFAGNGSNATLTTYMDLSSDTQPEVRQLQCMRWGTIRLDGWVTIAEMQAALGGVVSLKIAN